MIINYLDLCGKFTIAGRYSASDLHKFKRSRGLVLPLGMEDASGGWDVGVILQQE